MKTSTRHRKLNRANHQPPAASGGRGKALLVLIISMIGLSACGGGSSADSPGQSAQLSGNWQFTFTNPTDDSFLGGLQGGFLLQNGASVTGGAVFSISVPQQPPTPPTVCSSGSASIAGTITGQNVTLTAVAGNQTFTLTGMLSADNSTMTGTYISTAGTAPGGTSCGTAQSNVPWMATSVPPLTGAFQGSFHSTQSGASFRNQDFPVSGTLTQGENTGASNATVTGTLIFKDPVTLLNDYPCLTTASVDGQISGNSVVLQIFPTNGADVGQIGGIATTAPVIFDGTQSGYVLHNVSGPGPGYAIVNTKACPGVSLQNAGDSGNICLAFGNTTACTEPITLSPIALTFPPQALGSAPTTQTITLTNTDPSGSTLTGLSLSFLEVDSEQFYSGVGGDFNGLPNFIEQDTCATSLGSSFTLTSQQSCTITISFSPQESCPWLPYGSPPTGDPPARCPSVLAAGLAVNSPKSADRDTSFLVPISGSALSAVVPSTPELDFGAEALGESSLGQTFTFTNQGANPVQILPAANTPCTYSPNFSELPRPVVHDGAVAGLQVARTDTAGANIYPDPSNHTVEYYCDADRLSGQPNFQISSDTCLGALLTPQQSCSLQITFVPQKGTGLSGLIGNGLDYFLELNTLQCTSGVTNDCEIDSGRFPVELKTNPPSPLRMSPGAGLDFGFQTKGTTSAPITVTLFNDPADPNSATVNFAGKIVRGDYLETDTCPFGLTPGSSCTLTITFTPTIVGFDPGTITLGYNNGQFQTIYLRGYGQ